MCTIATINYWRAQNHGELTYHTPHGFAASLVSRPHFSRPPEKFSRSVKSSLGTRLGLLHGVWGLQICLLHAICTGQSVTKLPVLFQPYTCYRSCLPRQSIHVLKQPNWLLPNNKNWFLSWILEGKFWEQILTCSTQQRATGVLVYDISENVANDVIQK